MKTLTTDEFTQWLDEGEDMLLIDVLPPEHFVQQHIPGAANVPLERADFVQQVERIADGDKRRRIVVYCANRECPASPAAAKRLEQADFRDVYDFANGIEGYAATGRQLASGRPLL